MNAALEKLLTELERFGATNDETITERAGRMLNITRDTGEFLALMIRATNARRILEIGTSNGYSTLWLAAAAAATDGEVTTIELSPYKHGLAAENFARTHLSSRIRQVRANAGDVLAQTREHAYDLIFLDSERPEYPGWWPQLKRVMRPGGLLIVDNAVSHAEQLAPFIALVQADPEFTTCSVPVGKGEFLATPAKK